jgi:hypothetical protein
VKIPSPRLPRAGAFAEPHEAPFTHPKP